MPDAYAISITRRVRKIIDALERQEAMRVSRAIDELAIDPRPAGCLKIQSEDNVWRIRVGDYRIGYTIDDSIKLIVIVRVGHRSEFYR